MRRNEPARQQYPSACQTIANQPLRATLSLHPMKIRAPFVAALAAASMLLSSCADEGGGPIVVSAIGNPPALTNPNLKPLDSASAFLTEATAQGLVRFDPAGQVEPALAQSWTVSDDGRRYTFRIARAEWPNGDPVTSTQVVERLRAAVSRASKNPLKPLLLVLDEVEVMTDQVLEISLRAPRPNFLQLLAQPELAIVRNLTGSGPFRPTLEGDAVRLSLPEDEDDVPEDRPPPIILRGERAAMAVARFSAGMADLVTGGTVGDLPIARAADPPAAALRFDPSAGMLGLAFVSTEGIFASPDARRALSMAIDRAALVAAFGVPDLAPRESIVGSGIDELPTPAVPAWAATPLAGRRSTAAASIQALSEGEGEEVTVRVAISDAPGHRLLFAHLSRDWRTIGVTAIKVAPDAEAELRLIDAVAPGNVATWYLRRFACGASAVCNPEADALLDAARLAQTAAERQRLLEQADLLLTEAVPFIPLSAPVRWSLVSPRLAGFQPNPFARHFAGALLARRR